MLASRPLLRTATWLSVTMMAQTTLAQSERSAAPSSPSPLSTVARHFSLSAGAGYGLHAGKLASSAGFDRNAGDSLDLQLQGAWGLSRHVAVGLAFDWASFSGADGCGSCTGTSLAVAPFVRYHLVQGTRFDPWLAVGLGWRQLELEHAPDAGTYQGIDWLRLQVGGDWYATSNLGVGPYVGLNLARFSTRPASAGDAAAAWSFTSGIRLALDFPGK
jgi:hypothetical protein